MSWHRVHLFSWRSTFWTNFSPSAEKAERKKHLLKISDTTTHYCKQVISTLCFLSFTIQSIPEIIPATTKGLAGATPNVTSSPVPGAFCDRIEHQRIWEQEYNLKC